MKKIVLIITSLSLASFLSLTACAEEKQLSKNDREAENAALEELETKKYSEKIAKKLIFLCRFFYLR